MEPGREDPSTQSRKATGDKGWMHRARGWMRRSKGRKSFRGKILRPTIAVMLLLVLFLCHYLSTRFLSFLDAVYEAKTTANISALKHHLLDAESHTKIAATGMAANPKAVLAIKNKNRNDIIEIFSSTLESYGVTHYTICDGKGIVLARTLAPDKFGDSASDQHNISEALQGRVSSLFEGGSIDRVAARTGAPVRDANGSIIGVVSAGVRFDTDEAVDELHNLFNADVTIILGDTRVATTLKRKDGQRITGTTIDPYIAKIVIDSKHEHFGNVNILGESHKSFYLPVLDSNNNAFATFSVGDSTSNLSAEIVSLVIWTAAFGFAGLAISIGLLTVIITVLSKDITILSRSMNDVAQGNLDVNIHVKRKDEVGRLAKSMRMVVNTISRLLQDINIMIAEHEKGNTHYRIDVDAFQGEFKVLANNILKLSDMGIRDHLTGLPNRRSFDNRFELEWSRAKRDENSIGVLMLDLDHFKDYNDKFGHQQGDAALRETAKAILRVIKRKVDFVARWGGEEFAVLLPSTDMGGAITVASQIREEVERMAIPCTDEGAERITISIGVNTQTPSRHSSLSLLISGADEALYKAKQMGRNRVEVWTQSDKI